MQTKNKVNSSSTKNKVNSSLGRILSHNALLGQVFVVVVLFVTLLIFYLYIMVSELVFVYCGEMVLVEFFFPFSHYSGFGFFACLSFLKKEK